MIRNCADEEPKILNVLQAATGFQINKGWIVNVDARSLHYDPTIYDNPTTFDPWRFNVRKPKKKAARASLVLTLTD